MLILMWAWQNSPQCHPPKALTSASGPGVTVFRWSKMTGLDGSIVADPTCMWPHWCTVEFWKAQYTGVLVFCTTGILWYPLWTVRLCPLQVHNRVFHFCVCLWIPCWSQLPVWDVGGCFPTLAHSVNCGWISRVSLPKQQGGLVVQHTLERGELSV